MSISSKIKYKIIEEKLKIILCYDISGRLYRLVSHMRCSLFTKYHLINKEINAKNTRNRMWSSKCSPFQERIM